MFGCESVYVKEYKTDNLSMCANTVQMSESTSENACFSFSFFFVSAKQLIKKCANNMNVRMS